MRAEPKPQTLADIAYHRIRNMILGGELALGTPISRRGLSEQFGMSPIPVAAALERLHADGLLESRPRSGTRVRVPTRPEILGHYIVREALESQAAQLFAQSSSPRQRTELMKRARRLDRLFAVSPLLKLERAKRLFDMHHEHFLFHMFIAESTGVLELVAALERTQVLIFQWLYNSAAHFDTQPLRWHESLAKALCSGNPATADQEMRRHVRFRRDVVADRIAVYTEAEAGAALGFRLRRERRASG